MDESQGWREFLGRIIADSAERQRLAEAVRVNAVTLSRWVNGNSIPRLENIRSLLDTLPLQQRTALLDLLTKDFPEIATEVMATDEEPRMVPSACYAKVLSAYADMPESLYFWSVCKLTMQQALEQLDPRRLGMIILLAQCTPPSGQNKVRSLRGNTRLGTPLQSDRLEQEPLFLGVESLSGLVVSSCRPAIVQDFKEEGHYRGHVLPGTESAAAYPILRRGRVAGSVVVISTQVNYFTHLRLALVQQYANLLALAFEPEEFYVPERIELGVMPSTAIQRPYFAKFRHRVGEVMKAFVNNYQPISSVEAERLVWQQLEEELLQLPAHIASE